MERITLHITHDMHAAVGGMWALTAGWRMVVRAWGMWRMVAMVCGGWWWWPWCVGDVEMMMMVVVYVCAWPQGGG